MSEPLTLRERCEALVARLRFEEGLSYAADLLESTLEADAQARDSDASQPTGVDLDEPYLPGRVRR